MTRSVPKNDYYNFIQNWQDKNRENIQKWGWQDAEALLLVMQEELGELVQAVLEYRYEGGGYQEMYDELDDLAAIMFAMHYTLEHGVEKYDPEANEMDEETKKDLIIALLRAKRKVKAHDLDLTAEMNRLQRNLEEDVGVTGVELAPEYSIEA